MMFLGNRIANCYYDAIQMEQKTKTELQELESALEETNPGILLRFKKSYEERGGEQFRPDPSKVKCKKICFSIILNLSHLDPTKQQSFELLKKQYKSSVNQQSNDFNVQINLANDGLDLEIEW